MSLPPHENEPCFSYTTAAGGWGTSLQPGKVEVKDLHLAFAGVNRVEPVFPDVWLEESNLLPKSILSCQASHFLVLWLERAGFSWHFLVYT